MCYLSESWQELQSGVNPLFSKWGNWGLDNWSHFTQLKSRSGSILESCTIKKVEHLRIDAFKLWCWKRLLRVPWTARRSNQSILKEINPEYSLEGLMLKLQYFGHLMQRANSLEKTLMPGKIEGGKKGDNRGLNGWLASPTQQNKLWTSSGRWWRTGKPGMLQSMGSQKVRHDWSTEQQQQTRDQTQALGGDSTKS